MRDKITSERELKHFERKHHKEAAKEVGHIESPREFALRQARDKQSKDKVTGNRVVEILFDADESDEEDEGEPARPSVFTVKTSSED